jgi:hypothetical protein
VHEERFILTAVGKRAQCRGYEWVVHESEGLNKKIKEQITQGTVDGGR